MIEFINSNNSANDIILPPSLDNLEIGLFKTMDIAIDMAINIHIANNGEIPINVIQEMVKRNIVSQLERYTHIEVKYDRG